MDSLFVVGVACISSLTRASINLIDRWQFAYQKECVIQIAFLNNFLPLFLAISGGLFLGYGELIFKNILCLEAFFLGVIIQTVAITFSYAMKKYELLKVTLMTRVSDFFIPIVFGFIGGFHNINQIGVQSIGFLITVPLFLKLKIFEHSSFCFLVLIVLGITAQAIFGRYLMENQLLHNNFEGLIFFTIGVIFWRTIWTLPLFFCKLKNLKIFISPSKITLLRSILTLVTQISFIYIISSIFIDIALPILNLTGLFSILLASLLMKEKLGSNVLGLIFLTFLISGVSNYV
jgi:hypothetical protein